MGDENIITKDKTNDSKELAEDREGDKESNEGFKEEANRLKVLLDMHEGVPLEDPGPSAVSEDGEGRVAGATQ